MKEVGFEGTLEEFLQHLKNDPQFYLDKKVEHLKHEISAVHLIFIIRKLWFIIVKKIFELH